MNNPVIKKDYPCQKYGKILKKKSKMKDYIMYQKKTFLSIYLYYLFFSVYINK